MRFADDGHPPGTSPSPDTGPLARASTAVTAFPVTAIVSGLTAVVGAIQFGSPAVLQTLQRDPGRLHAGQWWRLATPLLVQPSGWGQLAFNLLGTVLVGVAVERRLGSRRWLATYLAAGLAGNVFANVWQPAANGGGSSDAVAGLIGALVVAVWYLRSLPPWPSYLYAVYFASYLTLLDAAGLLPAMVLGAGAAALVMGARRGGHLAAVRVLLTTFVVVGAIAMTALKDGHGIGLLTGLLLAALTTKRVSTEETSKGSSPRIVN